MKTARVPSSELSPKTLRAQDHVYAFQQRAAVAAFRWREDNDPSGLLNVRGQAYKALVSAIEQELRLAYEAGQKGR